MVFMASILLSKPQNIFRTFSFACFCCIFFVYFDLSNALSDA